MSADDTPEETAKLLVLRKALEPEDARTRVYRALAHGLVHFVVALAGESTRTTREKRPRPGDHIASIEAAAKRTLATLDSDPVRKVVDLDTARRQRQQRAASNDEPGDKPDGAA